jgi:hypothetical protein
MEPVTKTAAAPIVVPNSNAALWTGRVISTLVVLFLLFDGLMKVIREPHVLAASADLGYPMNSIAGIGATLLACTLLYASPRTAIAGAVLLTGYLGGAVASNIRVGHEFFQCMFPVIFGVFVWVGIFLRDVQLREMIPLRKRK